MGERGPQGEPGPPGPAGVSAGYDPDWAGEGLDAPGDADSAAYVQNGNLVHFRILIDGSKVNDFGLGPYTVQLPFPPIQKYVFRDGGISDGDHGNQYDIVGDADPNSTLMYLLYRSGTRDVPVDANSPVNMNAGVMLYISGTYEISR
jgi:hypothetical protein